MQTTKDGEENYTRPYFFRSLLEEELCAKRGFCGEELVSIERNFRNLDEQL
jgi:hypothetical protein